MSWCLARELARERGGQQGNEHNNVGTGTRSGSFLTHTQAKELVDGKGRNVRYSPYLMWRCPVPLLNVYTRVTWHRGIFYLLSHTWLVIILMKEDLMHRASIDVK